jgi:hypothetical protein
LHNSRVADDADNVFRALADPGRRLLLDRLRADNGQTLGRLVVPVWRGREKLHYLNPVPIHEIAERWVGRFEQGRLRLLADLKRRLEGDD